MDTIGFDTHYKYDSGREGGSRAMGFYTTSRVCVYIKRLNDIELSIPEQIVRQSYGYIKSQDRHMHRATE